MGKVYFKFNKNIKIGLPLMQRFYLIAVLCSLLLAGCGTVRLEVPPGHQVRLLEPTEYAEVKVKRTVWFWLWGARAISDNSTQKDILEHNLKEIRLQTEQNMADNLTILVTAWFTIVRRTMIVEGNTDTILETSLTQAMEGE